MKAGIGILFLIVINGCQDRNHSLSSSSLQNETWSVRMAETVMNSYDSLVYYNSDSGKNIKWQYDVAMVGSAIDKLGEKDEKYSDYLENYLDYFIDSDGTVKNYKKEDYNLDNINPAKNLITLYKRTGEEKYELALNKFIDQLKNQPTTKEGGFWHKKRYPWQMWLDGIYMASPFMAQYAQEFNDKEWFGVAARQVTLIYKMTADSATGLLYHAWDESHEQRWCDSLTGRSHQFWGRAMGWYMMALADMLDYLPENYPQREEILNIFNNTAEALLKVRDPATGLWYQVLDKGGNPGNYLEASCSCMFTYAFAKGARNKYLPEKYYSIAEDSFNAILKQFINVDPDGKLTLKDVCGGCGLGGNPYRDGTYNYYITEKKVDNDPKGVGPFILAAIELNK